MAEDAKVPKLTTKEMEVWSPEQLSAFLEHVATDRMAALWRLAATTGMRRGELLGLRWADVDFEAGALTVSQSLTIADYKTHISTPKTDGSRRRLTLDPATLAALRAHRARQSAERLALGVAWQDTGLVFTREDGGEVHPHLVSRWFDQRLKAAGLPRITFHAVRHSYATMLLRGGQPIHRVSKRLGHSKPTVTLNIYGHVLPGDDEEAALAGAELLSPTANATGTAR